MPDSVIGSVGAKVLWIVVGCSERMASGRSKGGMELIPSLLG